MGCLLYELLSGRDPFWTPRPDGLRQGHLESPPPPLGVLVSGVPAEGLDRLVAQCLAKEKGDRYTSPSELLDAISRLYEAWHREPPRAVPEAEGFTASDYNSRGNTYAALGRHAEALADFEAAIRIAPNLAQAHLNKGVLHTKREEWDDALQAFETAAHLGNATGAQYAARVRQVRGPRHRT